MSDCVAAELLLASRKGIIRDLGRGSQRQAISGAGVAHTGSDCVGMRVAASNTRPTEGQRGGLMSSGVMTGDRVSSLTREQRRVL